MAYSRMLENDIYVFATNIAGLPALYCCMCPLEEGFEQTGFVARRTQDMLEHLEEHRKVGHRMPSTINEELLADDAENFPVRSA